MLGNFGRVIPAPAEGRRDLVGADIIRPKYVAPINGGPGAARPTENAGKSFDIPGAAARVCRTYEVFGGQLFSGAGNSTFDRDIAALRARPLIFCRADAETTPVLRTLEPCAPKVRQSFLFTDQTAIFFFKRKWGFESFGRPKVAPTASRADQVRRAAAGGCYPPLHGSGRFTPTPPGRYRADSSAPSGQEDRHGRPAR